VVTNKKKSQKKQSSLLEIVFFGFSFFKAALCWERRSQSLIYINYF
jgi:hypothetical protein